ncbi:MAG: HAMP domain-containing histidine kinase, partial [Chloroflexi bacterium]
MKELSVDPPWPVAAAAVLPPHPAAPRRPRVGTAIAVVEALKSVVSPSPAVPALMLAVVLSALIAEAPLGLLIGAAASAYLAWHLSQPGLPPHWTLDDRVRIVEFAPAALLTAAVVGLLQQRAVRRVVREREHRERMAELERLKGEFLNLASHELRGPLSVLRGYVSMIEDGSFGPLEGADMRRAAPVLGAKVGEMALLVDKMLETARLEESELDLSIERLDLRDVAQRAVDAVAPLATPAHEVRWEPPREPVTVMGDSVRIGIIITNLLHNAVKYSPGGGVVQCFLTTAQDTAVLTVWDQGLGVDEADLQRLFTRFGRLVTPENSHIPGTGL